MVSDAEQVRFLAEFGLRLKLLRTRAGLSEEEAAEAAGMHRTFWGQAERGQRGMNIVHLPASPPPSARRLVRCSPTLSSGCRVEVDR